MVGLYVRVRIKPEFETRFEEILRRIVPASRADAGCVVYECGRVQGESGVWCFVEIWRSKADQAAHMQSAHMLAHADAIAECKEGESELKFIELVEC